MEELKNLGNLELVKKRLEIIIAARLRKQDSIKNSIDIQDELSKKSGLWSGENEIKKWRKKH